MSVLPGAPSVRVAILHTRCAVARCARALNANVRCSRKSEMSKRWETHRGDEWWYEDYWCKVSAGRSANIFSIDSIKALPGQLTKERLHEFLWLTQEQLKGETILLSILAPEVKAGLESLSHQGAVEYEQMDSRFSKEARIMKVAPFAEQKTEPDCKPKKRWWLW